MVSRLSVYCDSPAILWLERCGTHRRTRQSETVLDGPPTRTCVHAGRHSISSRPASGWYVRQSPIDPYSVACCSGVAPSSPISRSRTADTSARTSCLVRVGVGSASASSRSAARRAPSTSLIHPATTTGSAPASRSSTANDCAARGRSRAEGLPASSVQARRRDGRLRLRRRHDNLTTTSSWHRS